MKEYLGPSETLIPHVTQGPMRFAPGQWIAGRLISCVLNCASTEKQRLLLKLRAKLARDEENLRATEAALEIKYTTAREAHRSGKVAALRRVGQEIGRLNRKHTQLRNNVELLHTQIDQVEASSQISETRLLLKGSQKYAGAGLDDLEELEEVLDQQVDTEQQLMGVNRVMQSSMDSRYSLYDETGADDGGGDIDELFQSLFVPPSLRMDYEQGETAYSRDATEHVDFPRVPQSAPQRASRKAVLVQ